MGVQISKSGVKRPIPSTDKEKAVCRRCKIVMQDREPDVPDGEFYHPDTGHCPNDRTTFSWLKWEAKISGAHKEKEIVPFLRKRYRRAAKRSGIR